MDINGNGTLEISEVIIITHICNGQNGTDGNPGPQGPAGLNVAMSFTNASLIDCPDGGIELHFGVDTNSNSILDFSEILISKPICNGADGVDGQTGPQGVQGIQGQQGFATLARFTSATIECPLTGGVKYETAIDLNNNGIFDDVVTSSTYTCNIPGQPGADGLNAAQLCLNVSCPVTTKADGCRIYTCVTGSPCVVTGIVPDCCSTDIDCDTFMPCYQGTCQQQPLLQNNTLIGKCVYNYQPSCTYDTDCAIGKICQGCQCVPIPTENTTNSCFTSSDCFPAPSGTYPVCENNYTCTFMPLSSFCSSDLDCTSTLPGCSGTGTCNNQTGICSYNYADSDSDGIDCSKDCDDNDANIGLPLIWYRDADGDSFGNPGLEILSCSQPVGYVSNGTDCNDFNSFVRPGSYEVCNGVDDNCDGEIDNAPVFVFNSTILLNTQLCPQYSLLTNNQDCLSSRLTCIGGLIACNYSASVFETCNGIDDNCDGIIDNGASSSCQTYTNALSSCSSGSCQYTCLSGWKNCSSSISSEGGCLTGISSSLNNCGGCGISCNATNYEICYDGLCTQLPSGKDGVCPTCKETTTFSTDSFLKNDDFSTIPTNFGQNYAVAIYETDAIVSSTSGISFFEKSTNSWVFKSFHSTNLNTAVSIYGNYAVASGNTLGNLYFFKKVLNNWTILTSYSTNITKFGFSNHMHDRYIIFGTRNFNLDKGRVDIFYIENNDTFTSVQLNAPSNTSEFFGCSVKIRNSKILVGTYVRVVYVYKKTNNVWFLIQRIAKNLGSFGHVVGMTDNYIVIPDRFNAVLFVYTEDYNSSYYQIFLDGVGTVASSSLNARNTVGLDVYENKIIYTDKSEIHIYDHDNLNWLKTSVHTISINIGEDYLQTIAIYNGDILAVDLSSLRYIKAYHCDYILKKESNIASIYSGCYGNSEIGSKRIVLPWNTPSYSTLMNPYINNEPEFQTSIKSTSLSLNIMVPYLFEALLFSGEKHINYVFTTSPSGFRLNSRTTYFYDCIEDLSFDENNCGSCGFNCSSLSNTQAQICTAGVCNYNCSVGYKDCDLQTSNGCEYQVTTNKEDCGCSRFNCSTLPNILDTSCNDTTTCTIVSCLPNFGNCDSNITNGCESNLLTNSNNCGSCGSSCGGNNTLSSICSGGSCQLCPVGTGNCDLVSGNQCEINLLNNTNNCGSCGNNCAILNYNSVTSYKCQNGSCVINTCALTNADCDGIITNGCETIIQNSTSNCGVCGNNCSSLPQVLSSTCSGGSCQINSCLPSYGNCDLSSINGCEINFLNSTQNCGVCGNSCSALFNSTGVCVGGVCQSCPNFTRNCDGLSSNGCEVNIQNSTENCGACGNSCSASINSTGTCSSGVCQVCDSFARNCDGLSSNGCETNITANPLNCGGCNVTCPNAVGSPLKDPLYTGVCVNSLCTLCGATTRNCDNTTLSPIIPSCEVNIQTNPNNCGGCGNVCNLTNVATHTCGFGNCGIGTCSFGFANCDVIVSNGCEKDVSSDVTSCGSCSTNCNSLPNIGSVSCSNSSCVISACITPDYVNCDLNSANGCEELPSPATCCPGTGGTSPAFSFCTIDSDCYSNSCIGSQCQLGNTNACCLDNTDCASNNCDLSKRRCS